MNDAISKELFNRIENGNLTFTDLVSYIVKGADINYFDSGGHTIPMILFYGTWDDLLDFIFDEAADLGLDVRKRNEFGNTILTILIINFYNEYVAEKIKKKICIWFRQLIRHGKEIHLDLNDFFRLDNKSEGSYFDYIMSKQTSELQNILKEEVLNE